MITSDFRMSSVKSPNTVCVKDNFRRNTGKIYHINVCNRTRRWSGEYSGLRIPVSCVKTRSSNCFQTQYL
jgi:hypothetical protein